MVKEFLLACGAVSCELSVIFILIFDLVNTISNRWAATNSYFHYQLTCDHFLEQFSCLNALSEFKAQI